MACDEAVRAAQAVALVSLRAPEPGQAWASAISTIGIAPREGIQAIALAIVLVGQQAAGVG